MPCATDTAGGSHQASPDAIDTHAHVPGISPEISPGIFAFVSHDTFLPEERMTEQTTTSTGEGSFDLAPTALYRLEADALAFRASSGKHPASEGWRPLELDRELLAGVLDLHGLAHVVMPHEWTGAGGSDLFTAANFTRLLDDAEAPA